MLGRDCAASQRNRSAPSTKTTWAIRPRWVYGSASSSPAATARSFRPLLLVPSRLAPVAGDAERQVPLLVDKPEVLSQRVRARLAAGKALKARAKAGLARHSVREATLERAGEGGNLVIEESLSIAATAVPAGPVPGVRGVRAGGRPGAVAGAVVAPLNSERSAARLRCADRGRRIVQAQHFAVERAQPPRSRWLDPRGVAVATGRSSRAQGGEVDSFRRAASREHPLAQWSSGRRVRDIGTDSSGPDRAPSRSHYRSGEPMFATSGAALARPALTAAARRVLPARASRASVDGLEPRRAVVGVDSRRTGESSSERVSPEDHLRERMFTGLRLAEGIDLAALERDLDLPVRDRYSSRIQRNRAWRGAGLVRRQSVALERFAASICTAKSRCASSESGRDHQLLRLRLVYRPRELRERRVLGRPYPLCAAWTATPRSPACRPPPARSSGSFPYGVASETGFGPGFKCLPCGKPSARAGRAPPADRPAGDLPSAVSSQRRASRDGTSEAGTKSSAPSRRASWTRSRRPAWPDRPGPSRARC